MKLAVSVLAAVCALGQEPRAPRTIQDGIYTTEQAERGRQAYKRSCAECHALDWYRGETMKAWDGAPLFNLYEVIATTMPQSNPGSLKRSDYVALLAYILSLNELPAGKQDLPGEPDALKEILIQWRNKP